VQQVLAEGLGQQVLQVQVLLEPQVFKVPLVLRGKQVLQEFRVQQVWVPLVLRESKGQLV
jgi:hypothetical protein